jgi:hypothetical protein
LDTYPEYEGYYEVSTLGRVKSLARKVWNGSTFFIKPERILKPSFHRFGYPQVHLSKNGRAKNTPIHSLVMLAFKGPRPSEMECRHFPDQNPANNYVINLSCSTRKINQADKVVNGTQQGEGIGFAKLTEEQVRAIYSATGTQEAIAKRFGISHSQVSRIKSGENWGWLKKNLH